MLHLTQSSTELGSLSRFHKVCAMEISVPWPVANREAVVDCFGVDLLEQHKFVVFMKSVDQHPKIAIPAVKDGA